MLKWLTFWPIFVQKKNRPRTNIPRYLRNNGIEGAYQVAWYLNFGRKELIIKVPRKYAADAEQLLKAKGFKLGGMPVTGK